MSDPWRGRGVVVTTPDAPVWSANGPTSTEFGVFLPHSCDEWVIADSPDRSEALAQLDRFIAALGEVRERLAAS